MDYIRLFVSIILCQLAGYIGSIFTTRSIPTWYKKLKKPSFNPPNWVFAPVWTILYLLMGISMFLIWTSGKDITLPMSVFFIQLMLNVSWSYVFFGLRMKLLGFRNIILLWISILASIILFYKISLIASLLLIPYILWVSFASLLNYYLWKLNPEPTNNRSVR